MKPMGEKKRFLSERIRGNMNRPTKRCIILAAGIVAVILIISIISIRLYVTGNQSNVTTADISSDIHSEQVITGMMDEDKAAGEPRSLGMVMVTPQPTDLDAANVYAGKAPIYPELDEELLERQLNRTRWIDDMIREDANLPLHGCEGYYIVTIPVICYNAQLNQYAVDGNYLVFEDITDLGNNAGLQAVLSADGTAQTSGFISGLIPKYLTEIMIANPDQEYIFLYNGTAMCMIDEDNTLYTSPYSDELQVVGDYYHALDYKNIAVSYRNLTDSAHLLYYRDDDSDGSYVRQALPD